MATIDDITGKKPGGGNAPEAITPGPLSGGGIAASYRQSVSGGTSGNGGADTNAQVLPLEPERGTFYEEWFKRENSNPRMSAEQAEMLRKKEKREKVFAAISDGISALSNLYFTTRYAPNMHTGRGSQSERAEGKWAKLYETYNDSMKAYIDGLRKAREADGKRYDTDRDVWLRLKEQAEARAKAEADRAARAAEAEKGRKFKAEEAEKERMFKAEEEEKTRDNQRRIAYARNRDGGGRGKQDDAKSFRVGASEFVEVPSNRLNAANLKQIIDMLPQQAQEELRGKSYTVKVDGGKYGEDRYETRYEEPDADTYYRIIGSYMYMPEVANAMRELGGKPTRTASGGETDWSIYEE